MTGDAVDHGRSGRETRRDLVVAGLAQHDPGDRRPLAVDPADGPEGEAACGRVVRGGLDDDKPVVPEQCVGVVYRAGDWDVALGVATMLADARRRMARPTMRTWSAAVDTVASS
jgi:hypothetical protein